MSAFGSVASTLRCFMALGFVLMAPRARWRVCVGWMVVLAAFVPLHTHGEEAVWVVAGIPERPLRWLGDDGRLQGFDIELLEAVMRKIGVAYRVELVDASERIHRNVRAQPSTYDMVLDYSYNPEREALFQYPRESHLRLHWNFFVLRENASKFKFERFQDLQGAVIGVTKGFSYTPEFWEAVETVPRGWMK